MRVWPLVTVLVVSLAGCGGDEDGSVPSRPKNTVAYRVPSESMKPTYDVGDVIDVDVSARLPRRGDVIVFRAPAVATGVATAMCRGRDVTGTVRMCARVAKTWSKDTRFIKRVVAVAGDRISMRGGLMIVDGRLEPSHPVAACEDREVCLFPATITVPAGTVYVLGDNRGASLDSRFFGPVPLDVIVGSVY